MRMIRLPIVTVAAMLGMLAACGDDPPDGTDAGGRDAGPRDSGSEPDGGGDADGGGDDAGAEMAGDSYGLTSMNRLASFDRATGAVRSVVAVTGIESGETIVGMDFRPRNGSLVVVTRDGASAGRLYEVVPETGVASGPVMLSAPLSGERFGIDFNPAADALRIVSDAGQNLRVNPTTGATTVDGALNPATTEVASAAYTNSQDDTCRTQLYVIDAGSDRLRLQSPPNAGTLVDVGDGLGVDATGAVGLEIVTTLDASMRMVNAAIATLTVAGDTRLYDVDLTDGTASNPRAITGLLPGEALVDLAVAAPSGTPVQDPGDYWGVTEDARLVSFNRAAPRNFCTASEIAGLLAGESIVGIDTRPATLAGEAKLYGIGRVSAAATGARLLEIDVSDPAAVTASGSMLLSPSTGTAFAGLTGTSFAVDFNPAADLLRVIGDDGQNLRIVPPGRVSVMPPITEPAYTTFTDTSLSDGGTPALPFLGVSAAAYADNDVDVTTPTTLYGIDTTLDRLVRIGADPGTAGPCPATPSNPNCGVVAVIGALGLPAGTDVIEVNGFDIETIDGVDTARAVLRTDAAATSTLYDVNLATGAATAPGPIGTNDPVGTTHRIVGLARRVVP